MDSTEKTEAPKHEIAGPPAIISMTPKRRAQVEKSMERKLDARCSYFIILYIMNYLDRNNIAAARLKGLEEDLNYNQYTTCLSILYIGYILMYVSSNIAINLVSRPSLYIGVSMLLKRLVSTVSGTVQDPTGMYTRQELTTRNALLFYEKLISGAFSALVGAGALPNIQGVLGHAAWRWLFYSWGLPESGLLTSFIQPDLPQNTRGFTEEELYVAQLCITEDFRHIIGPIILGFIVFIISMSTLNVAARYVSKQAVMLASCVFYSWISSSFPRPPAKRAVVIAMINAFSQLGNVAGFYVWTFPRTVTARATASSRPCSALQSLAVSYPR
ncbi:putative tartrate transporter [Madurella mycetomatis]|uniref:Tartrate transporter n=1 Tax=Madurella mycetomatis TaxID=100816 RepID=A0A175VPH1_9PEZI|nr:putative tartrate transporter [Madurella mycetomatis]